MRWIEGGVTAAAGFRASGVSARIKRSRKPDLALVLCENLATVAGVLTRNRVQAAPVTISRQRLNRGRARAILINSGCANCLTGPAGMRDALVLGGLVVRKLGVADEDLLLASTGIIGRRLPVDRIRRAIPALVHQLSSSGHRAAAEAMLTTDLQPKEVALEARIGGKVCRIGGMAKGAGMIAPSMATMLAVITTDATINPVVLRGILQQVTDRTFNCISVDGDMSTNDTVFALASGASEVTIRPGSRQAHAFAAMVEAVMGRLAVLIVKDGEGATRITEIEVIGARSEREAQACARQVALSPLVKTMLAGGDPNIGRIAAAVGASSAVFDPRHLMVDIGGRRVISHGVAVRVPKLIARRLLTGSEVSVRVKLGAGRARGRMLTCDLTEKYVRINARYST